jgi:hypothetical protein
MANVTVEFHVVVVMARAYLVVGVIPERVLCSPQCEDEDYLTRIIEETTSFINK